MRIWVERSWGWGQQQGDQRGGRNFGDGIHNYDDVTDKPIPTILAQPVKVVTEDGPAAKVDPDKPPYRPMPMAELAGVEPNGYRAISLFAGCGGSSLGYRQAGYSVDWASEFIPAARDSYAANFPSTFIDPRDIREVKAAEILEQLALEPGQLDVLDGSPPCISFSTAGKRDKHWGTVQKYSDTEQRSDDLFFDYARLVKDLQPRVFVAENVSGMVKGVSKGYFKLVLQALEDCGYRVSVKLLDAKWLGVPQARQRLIFVGVRQDLGLEPVHPKPLPYLYTVADVLPHIARYGHRAFYRVRDLDPEEEPAPTILGAPAWHYHRVVDHEAPPDEEWPVERDPDVPGDAPRFTDRAIYEEWRRLKPGKSSDKYLNLARVHPEKPAPTLSAAGGLAPGTAGLTHPYEPRKFTIAELRALCGFPPDFVLTGTYSQQWERLGNAVPPPMMRAVAQTVADEILARCPT